MDSQSNTPDELTSIKEMRRTLESRIETQRLSQQNLISSLQTKVPNLISSLDLSLHVISTFNNLHYSPTPIPPPPKPQSPNPQYLQNPKPPNPKLKLHPELSKTGNPIAILRSMIAVCLLERDPFTPIDSTMVSRKLELKMESLKEEEKAVLIDLLGSESSTKSAVETALRSMGEEFIGVELQDVVVNGVSRVKVSAIDRRRLVKKFGENPQRHALKPNSPDGCNEIDGNVVPRGRMDVGSPWNGTVGGGMMNGRNLKRKTDEDIIEEMLNKKSVKEMQNIQTGEELLRLINGQSWREKNLIEKFKTKGGSNVKEYCPSVTKDDCRRNSGSYVACGKLHFRRIIALHTDISLGLCSYLNTCRRMHTCKHIHYEPDLSEDVSPMAMFQALPPPKPIKIERPEYCSEVELGESQWISCDIRNFRMDILGQFGVIMADPPWDIHMDLPYGTMADNEMLKLNLSELQTDGLIFLWVTGRAIELGRDCLDLWGYKCIQEIVWVKTNQLQRIIRTGRTGHWLNHSKEHCLVGIKGNPEVIRNIDTDVVVAEVRETSRKPDEMYPLLERLSPRTRKLELFARMHNTHAGWISLGNQLKGVRLVDQGLRARFKVAYPDVEVQPPSPPRASAMEIDSKPLLKQEAHMLEGDQNLQQPSL